MYIRLVRFGFQPGRQDVAQRLADDLVRQIAAQPGCHGVTCFGDNERSEYGLYVRWETQESADAAAVVIRPQLNSYLEGNVARPPEMGLYQVINEVLTA